MEARVPSTFFLKVSSSKVFGPWLYADFISAVNEMGVDGPVEWHSEDLNCKKKKRAVNFYIKKLQVYNFM